MTDEEQMIITYKKVATSPSLLAVSSVFIPTPSEKDFTFGEIRRYFSQQANQPTGEINEISKGKFVNLQRKSLFIVVDLRWKISGPAESIFGEDGEIDIFGIREANEAAINQATKIMPAIKQKLTNLFQLWRGF